MGEMEEVDVDHITTDVPSHKVEKQGEEARQEPPCGLGGNARIRLALLKPSNEIKYTSVNPNGDLEDVCVCVRACDVCVYVFFFFSVIYRID